jgi:hypothetical protein
MRERIRATIETIVEEELKSALSATRSQRVGPVRVGYRHGKRRRTLSTSLGPTTIAMPRARIDAEDGRRREWRSRIIPRYQRRTERVDEAILGVYLSGTNARRLRGALARCCEGRRVQGLGVASGRALAGGFRGVGQAGARRNTFTAFPLSQWKALRTTNALERINEEFRRRTKTPLSLPNEEAVLLLPFGLLRSGQITLRRVVGWQDLILRKEPPKAAAQFQTVHQASFARVEDRDSHIARWSACIDKGRSTLNASHEESKHDHRYSFQMGPAGRSGSRSRPASSMGIGRGRDALQSPPDRSECSEICQLSRMAAVRPGAGS